MGGRITPGLYKPITPVMFPRPASYPVPRWGIMSEHLVRCQFRRFQLCAMGWTAIVIAPAAWFSMTVIHGLPFPDSISETGTAANMSSPILPFCLGALALFSLTYAVQHRYDGLDRTLPGLMCAGFTVVAMQMCESLYIETSRVGLLGLSKQGSGAVHAAGAVTGFGALIGWILFCFTKSNMPRRLQTREKRIRNRVYAVLGMLMVASLSLFLLQRIGLFGDEFPVVFWAEALMLTFGGIACLIKGGFALRDRAER